MRVVCENCGASYTVPDNKLTKAMNKATCKACAHEMLIPKPGTSESDDASANQEWEDEEQTRITESPLIHTPTPEPTKAPLDKPKPANLYDPSGDLAWAALGSFISLMGAFLLGLLSLPLGQFADVVLWAGLAFAFGGSVLTLSILSTGRRGRREANNLLSVVTAFCIGVFMSSTLTTAKWGGLYVAENYDFSFDQTAAISSSEPVEQEGLAEEDPEAIDMLEDGTLEEGTDEEEAADEEEGTDEEATGQEEEAPVSRPPPSSKKPAPRAAPPSTRSSPPSAPLVIEDIDDIEPIDLPARPQPAPAPRTRKQTRTRPAPAPAPVSNATVPLQTIQTIMHNTNSIKACFVPMYNAGTVPPRIDVKFTLGGNGTASDVTVVQSDFSGSPFEQCMRAAIEGIAFPPSGGAGQNINFPFILN